MSFRLIANLLGGIGLFLIAIQLMTQGLRLAAGPMLRILLSRWTTPRLRGVLTGGLITSVVQSSSAVTVATIGFVNAGLMSLHQAVAVIYGSNVGTTMTSWLVSLVGFDIDMKSVALPFLGIGMILRLLRGESRIGALGQALAGFGVFFIGIDFLKDGFASLGQQLQFPAVMKTDLLRLLIFTAFGFLLTVATQSSSAAMALILTATMGHVLPLTGAAAMIIGSNMGTTTTAALAVIGATPSAKRVAAAHIIFNAATALVAFFLLPVMLASIGRAFALFHIAPTPAIELAIFHTAFNVLGVALLWPVTNSLIALLQKRIRDVEEDASRPKYLDHTTLSTPMLAMHALSMELSRVGEMARRLAIDAVQVEFHHVRNLSQQRRILMRLVDSVADFCNRLQRSALPAALDNVLPDALRIARYHSEVAEMAVAIASTQAETALPAGALTDHLSDFRRHVTTFLEENDVQRKDFTVQQSQHKLEVLEAEYQSMKAQLLRAGTEGAISVRLMAEHLDILSDIRRMYQQMHKGVCMLPGLQAIIGTGEGE